MEGAGDRCRFKSGIERGPYQVCLSFGDLLGRAALFAYRRASRRAGCINLALFDVLNAPVDLYGNGLTKPLKLCVLQILERLREVARQRYSREKVRLG